MQEQNFEICYLRLTGKYYSISNKGDNSYFGVDQALWPTIGHEYFDMVQIAIAHGIFLDGIIDGLIALIYKGGGRTIFNNWRPITLLNINYKIFAKALQMRLQLVLVDVMSPNQSMFLLIRFILNNIFLTQKTIHYTYHSTQPLMFMKLNFSKAYNRVDFRFFFSTMALMGFSNTFISMTRLLFMGAKAAISDNGRCTPHFQISHVFNRDACWPPTCFLLWRRY
jgi:hypothetical protein